MASDKKGGGLLLALGLGKPKSKMSEDDSASSSGMKAAEAVEDGFDSAAMDAFEAVKSDDVEAFKLALKAAIHECSSDYSDDDME
jgi:hypothetical protein